MTTEAKEILEKLDHILHDVQELKRKLSDPDIYLTKTEKRLLEKSYIAEKKRKLMSHSELKMALGL